MESVSIDIALSTNGSTDAAATFMGCEASEHLVRKLDLKLATSIKLTSDAPVAVPFGVVTNAHVLYVRSRGKPVTARITSGAGATQAFTAELALFVTASDPYTAVDLTREAGVETIVDVFIGQTP